MINSDTVAVRLRGLADRIESLSGQATEAQVNFFEIDDRVDDVETAVNELAEEIEESLGEEADDEESDSDDEGDEDEEDE